MANVIARLVSRSIVPVMVFGLLGHLWASPAAARPVFNQSPAAMDRTFGRYWTKLTQRDGEGLYITYTYSPTKLRQLFPGYKVTRFALFYRNNQVRSAIVDLLDKSGEELIIGRDRIVSEKLEAKFFEGVLGYAAPTYKPLFEMTGVAPAYSDCLGDGVVSEYGQSAHTNVLSGLRLTYEARCVRPYDKIQLQVEKGPSGG
jgi:hypothetical protein